MAPDADCYLFGSRTDDAAKGGDIDILVITAESLPLPQISRMRRLILNQIGEQKLDIVNFPIASDHPFKRAVMENAIKL
jgi:predicted nucleotidyltransferase